MSEERLDERDETVVVTRGWGDHRRIEVSRSALSGEHVAVSAGGTSAPPPRPTVAAYMSCEDIPDGAEFGHSCEHGAGPHRIKVLAFKSHNADVVYRRLREAASVACRDAF